MLNIFFVFFFLICYAKYYSSIKIDSERADDFPGTKKKNFQLDDNRVTRSSGC